MLIINKRQILIRGLMTNPIIFIVVVLSFFFLLSFHFEYYPWKFFGMLRRVYIHPLSSTRSPVIVCSFKFFIIVIVSLFWLVRKYGGAVVSAFLCACICWGRRKRRREKRMVGKSRSKQYRIHRKRKKNLREKNNKNIDLVPFSFFFFSSVRANFVVLSFD